jgi:hypothetical protein
LQEIAKQHDCGIRLPDLNMGRFFALANTACKVLMRCIWQARFYHERDNLQNGSGDLTIRRGINAKDRQIWQNHYSVNQLA